MRLGNVCDLALAPFAKLAYTDHMKYAGIGNTRRLAKAYNRIRYRKRCELHRSAYQEGFAELLEENGGIGENVPVISDGWVIDRSKSLPHLDELLHETGKIIDERGGRAHSHLQKIFLRSMLFPGDIEQNPSILDFVTSSPVLKSAADHLGTVPLLSKTRPAGVRMMESNAKFDPTPDAPPRDSQNFHLDLHDTPLVYVLVLLRNVDEESGPWSFFPDSISSLAARRMQYQKRGVPYRVTDDMMYAEVSKSELKLFTGEAGDVMFIDSSRCFHYGSRNAVHPRFMMMYALTTPCRTDFTHTYMRPLDYPCGDDESRLRQLVLKPLP